jgi:hypothetical protein
MDIEFHYYMTYLIAARAGFPPPEAALIAQSAQEIDDNHIPLDVSAGTPAAYRSTITQTMDILRPHTNRKIYPIFHFIPGDPDAPSARRRDGLRSDWTTTPNSPLANELLDTALTSRSLYRIGASAHAYADTWAHQNFTGMGDVFNEMPDATLGKRIADDISLLRIGHALAGHRPDIPALLWSDPRLVDSEIDNTVRFLDAAYHLFQKLYGFKHGAADTPDFERAAHGLLADLKADIGPSSAQSAARDPVRIQRYRLRALEAAYGSAPLPDYVEAQWADEAFVEKRADVKTKVLEFVARHAGIAGDIVELGTRMQFTWADPDSRQDTHWYKYQEAVKSHLTPAKP